jgi:predicted nuclease of predicted toxin-antitoxin system
VVAIPLLIDENVPESVTALFRERGHSVQLVRELLLSGTPDPIIAAVADRMGAVVVTWDRDFNRLIQRVPKGGRGAVRRAGRISFSCNEARGRARLESIIESIEFEYERSQRAGPGRFIVSISESTFTFHH